ncbi:unnamed protein product [Choristocarpus tenellus]
MDEYEECVQVAPNTFRDYGGTSRFSGWVETIKCLENNPLVRERLTTEDGNGRVLVVDGGGSIRCALMGDQLATAACENGWKGVIVNGAIRDSVEIGRLSFGCKALCSNPCKSKKISPGERDVPLTFAGLQFRPGQYVYCDEDGIVVSDKKLELPRPKI